jgi:DNA-directed RNA polymerase subunit beta'
MYDCGTTQGITKGVVYRGEKVEVRLADAIYGRVSRQNIVNPVTDEVIVRENELITADIARRIEDIGLDRIQVRSPMTCDAPLGVCQLCYGMDLSTGDLVEQGMAVGIIAAQSIGEPGTQLTMRTFHIGGSAQLQLEEHEVVAKRAGIVRFSRIKVTKNREGRSVVLKANGEIALLDLKGRELEKYDVPVGATLLVEENQQVQPGQVLCEWDPHSVPLLCEVSGKVRYQDIIDGVTVRLEKDPTGHVRRRVIDFRGNYQPQIEVVGADGKLLDVCYVPEKAHIEVEEGQMVQPGDVVAKTPREASGITDITGGLPRVTELFEARKPKEPAVMAEIDGRVELTQDKRRGKRSIKIRSESGLEIEHLLPSGKRLLVHADDIVRAGTPLTEGPLVPHDILRVSGEEAVQQYLLHEVQQVYRSQRVDINDKHIEIIISRMLRKVRIDDPGDTNLLPGIEMDKFEFRAVNERLRQCVKIVDPGSTDFQKDAIVPREVFEERNSQVSALGGQPAKAVQPRQATASTQLLGISRAAVQSESFISAASFQETTKVLTEAALAGKVDRLVGLKENVILGHLIPAGTGFRAYQEADVKIPDEVLVALSRSATSSPTFSAPLLQAGDGNGARQGQRSPEASALDRLIGGDGSSS